MPPYEADKFPRPKSLPGSVDCTQVDNDLSPTELWVYNTHSSVNQLQNKLNIFFIYEGKQKITRILQNPLNPVNCSIY